MILPGFNRGARGACMHVQGFIQKFGLGAWQLHTPCSLSITRKRERERVREREGGREGGEGGGGAKACIFLVLRYTTDWLAVYIGIRCIYMCTSHRLETMTVSPRVYELGLSLFSLFLTSLFPFGRGSKPSVFLTTGRSPDVLPTLTLYGVSLPIITYTSVAAGDVTLHAHIKIVSSDVAQSSNNYIYLLNYAFFYLVCNFSTFVIFNYDVHRNYFLVL